MTGNLRWAFEIGETPEDTRLFIMEEIGPFAFVTPCRLSYLPEKIHSHLKNNP